MKSQEVPADWEAHERLESAVKDGADKGNERDIFRARCRSLLFLSEAFHRARQKEESFRPSWTPSPKA
jgi:protein phosphatase